MWLEELGVTERLVFYVFCAVAALDLVLALSVLVVGLIYRINTPGASLDFYIAFGSLAIMVSTLIRGADPEWGTISQLESLCAFYPSIITFGLLWFIGGLLLKACAIQNYFKYHAGDSVRAHEWKPNFWMILLMVVDAVIVMVWLLVYEPELIPRDPSGNELAKNLSMSGVEHYYTCEGEYFDYWMIGVSGLHALLLLLAGILIWVAVHNARRTPSSAEATLLSIAIYNTIFGVVGATLVHFYFDGSKSTTYAIVGGITFYIIFMTLLLILVMKVIAARRLKYSRGRDSGGYDKVDDRGRNSYHHDNYINETHLPTKKSKKKKEKKPKVKKEKKTKVKKEKKVKHRKSKASSHKSGRSSGYHDRDNYENDRYESDRYDHHDHDDHHDHRDSYHDRHSSRDRGSNRGSYYNDSQRGGGHYNDSQRSGHDNRAYESNRTSKVYNDSRGSYRESSYRDDRSDRGSYGRHSPEYRGSDRGSNRQSEVFAY